VLEKKKIQPSDTRGKTSPNKVIVSVIHHSHKFGQLQNAMTGQGTVIVKNLENDTAF